MTDYGNEYHNLEKVKVIFDKEAIDRPNLDYAQLPKVERSLDHLQRYIYSGKSPQA